MATTVNSDLIIYNDLAQTAFLERRQDNLEVFNQASNGAIVLDNVFIEGDLRKRAFYQISGSIEHRDVNSTDKVTGKKIGAGESVDVKAPWKYGPYEITEESFKRRGRDVSEFSELVGTDAADASLEGYIKYSLAALGAAIGANTDMMVTANIATDGKKTLTKRLRKYGDKFNRVNLFVMHSTTYFDIVDQAIDNKVYEEAGVVIYGGQPGTLGKPVLVTDTAPVDAIFGLVPGAITITESQEPHFRSYEINDQENLGVGYRGEGVVNVGVLGYSWDESKGTNPDLTKLGTAGNWKKHFTSNKLTAGVMIKLQHEASLGLSVDKTTATANNSDAVTISLDYSKDNQPVQGGNVEWSSTGGKLSKAATKTDAKGKSSVKLTASTAGQFTVTATVDGEMRTTESITFS
ncbi:MAG TPA: major capsid protein [Arsenophonus nasoniae]|uniref:major capsid protein n=1 Tax=Arsenophonus nasoniae TaxID=638 RepID=UPI00387A58D4